MTSPPFYLCVMFSCILLLELVPRDHFRLPKATGLSQPIAFLHHSLSILLAARQGSSPAPSTPMQIICYLFDLARPCRLLTSLQSLLKYEVNNANAAVLKG